MRQRQRRRSKCVINRQRKRDGAENDLEVIEREMEQEMEEKGKKRPEREKEG